MTEKITIDQEIESIKSFLDGREDVDPFYVGSEIKEIQGYVLVHHALVEGGIDSLILLKAKLSINLDEAGWTTLLKQIYPLVEKLSFHGKLELLRDEYLYHYTDVEKVLKSLGALNKLRNEWAHTKGDDLGAKYSYKTGSGKEKIRDAFRTIKRAHDALDEYFNAK